MWSEDIKEALRATAQAAKIMVFVVLLSLSVVTLFFLMSPAAYGNQQLAEVVPSKWPEGTTDIQKEEIRDAMWVTLVCDNWTTGYFDGYCVNQNYGCLAPTVAPLCPWQSLPNTRAAYERGYRKGELDFLMTYGGYEDVRER